MFVSLAMIALTALLVTTVLLTWAVDVRRVGRATSAREASGGTSDHARRVRQMQARLRAERIRAERTAATNGSAPASPAPPPTPDEARHRATLELPPGPVSPEALRRQYRALMAAYHPDRVAGLGRKLQALADEESKAINEAYAWFKRRLEPAD